MTLDKGKGKATAPFENDENQGQPSTNSGNGTKDSNSSLANRLGSSAAHLSRSLFTGRPEATDVSQLASSMINKSDASVAPAPPVAGESTSSVAAGPRQAATTNSYSKFRSSASKEVAEHAAQTEADFSAFLESTSVSIATESANLESAWSQAQPPVAGAGRSAGSGLAGHGSSISEQEAVDGAQVVELLAQDSVFELDNADFESQISQEEMVQLRRALFGDGLSGNDTLPQTWDRVLNFIPDFVRPDQGAVPGTVNHFKSTESQAVLGMAHGPEAESIWVGQWMDVLTSYNAEVWGDLGSLVQQAREELQQLEQAKPDGVKPEARAVWRLQQILGHVRSTKL